MKEVDENEGAADKKKYDGNTAGICEEELEQETEQFGKLINNLKVVLLNAKEVSKEEGLRVQTCLAEQGILQLLLKIIELIYYKTVPFEEREAPFPPSA